MQGKLRMARWESDEWRVSTRVYPHQAPYSVDALEQQRLAFPAGQLVAVDARSGALLGMAASLIVNWHDHDPGDVASAGHAAIIEWLNPRLTSAADLLLARRRFE